MERPKGTAALARFIPLAVLLAFLVLAFAYRMGMEALASVGQAAPAFRLERLDGGEMALDELRGRPVVLNFWTTWCVECHTEAPELDAFHRDFGDRVAVIGIDMREPASVARRFVEEYGLTYTVLLDRDGRTSRRYRVRGVPETWILDADGVARYHLIGPVDYARLEDVISSLAAERGGA